MATYGFSVLLITISLVVVTTYATLDADETVEFGYSGAKGPDKWGSLDPKFKVCSDGKAQSPIDIVRNKATPNDKLKALSRDYRSAPATLVNNGFNIAVHFDGSAGTMNVDGKNYSLLQMHWHTPSEHKMDGQQLDAELQLVHKADDGSISCTAILYQVGNGDSFLARIQKKLGDLAKDKCGPNEQAEVDLGELKTNQLRKSTRNYFRYNGSFTAPPCTENVIWFVFGKPKSMSAQQIEALKAPMEAPYKINSRPVQPDNGRVVNLHDVPKKN
ncbi:Carbonic anhydrase [Heracleum sosnowskyi]|uniref:Carbonic anhydrase n=1 Tax=Heracleum sosnowskyi TaxID=360622 RepID=A0AAD8HYN7_9APIA|nr:Carbonic anhydrase [Heracleum sosnowskyi]